MREALLGLPSRDLHLGVIEKWWVVNPLALLGALLGYARPRTKIPHAGHVLLSTLASLFHMTMALGTEISVSTAMIVALFLFLSVWIPCCTSDIVFPLLAARAVTEPSRKRWIEHEGVDLLRTLGIGPGDWVLDFGSNWGAYSLPAAKCVGESGRVFAVDADGKVLERLVNRASRLQLRNTAFSPSIPSISRATNQTGGLRSVRWRM